MPRRLVDRLVTGAVLLSGLVAILALAYGALVLVVGRAPTSSQQSLIAWSLLAAALTAVAYHAVRPRLEAIAASMVGDTRDSPAEVMRSFGARLTRAVPVDELLLQLAESLRKSLALDSAEVWTGSAGVLERVASDPDSGPATLVLTPSEANALVTGGVSGRGWLDVWLPQLLAGRNTELIRMAPITHAGELLGLILSERSEPGVPFAREDDELLGVLARQVGLALNNLRLGSALEASMEELRRQADELRLSRARVVAAADEERRRIERDLHDGAQQHLVGLIVNLRLARELAQSDPGAARELLEELSGEAHSALEDFRDLAHGIYPPLLVARGLPDGLRAALARLPVHVRLDADGVGRYSPEVEATAYFCCLEALQNAGKHAGRAARATVRLWEDERGLLFEVADDGAGFDPAERARGAGITNMGDRLGALGGTLSVASSPGAGTRVVGAIPVERLG
ncbi:MAG: sensor histidine kinase [Thermoleophilaceae bacterium]